MESTFTLLNAVFYLITILILFNVLYLVFLKAKISGSIYIAFNSLVLAALVVILLFNSGYLTDELNLSGSSVPFYTTIISGILAIVSIPLSLKNK